MAPAWRASASGTSRQPTGCPCQILSFTSSSIRTRSSGLTADGLAKSNRSQSSSTFEPCCKACSPSTFRRA